MNVCLCIPTVSAVGSATVSFNVLSTSVLIGLGYLSLTSRIVGLQPLYLIEL